MSDRTKHMIQLVGIAKTWAMKHLPGWCDETHRDLIARHGATAKGGRVSASTMSVAQLSAVLDDYERRGWPRVKKTFAPGGKPKTVSPQIAHLVRLWGRLGDAGKIDTATRPALLAFCSRQLGRRHVPNLDSLTTEEGQAITEALKAMLAR